jgi:hypothetical protein
MSVGNLYKMRCVDTSVSQVSKHGLYISNAIVTHVNSYDIIKISYAMTLRAGEITSIYYNAQKHNAFSSWLLMNKEKNNISLYGGMVFKGLFREYFIS